MRAVWLLSSLALSACATSSFENISENEQARREVYRSKTPVVCRDLRAESSEAPYLVFVIEEEARIADLKFSDSSRYERQELPRELDTYGPFKGERVTEGNSPYLGTNEFKITERLYLFLPDLLKGFEKKILARDRDSEKQNATVEVGVRDQRYPSIVHLRCIP